jgi:cytosine/adenosine deaminase-related metal-dependent hydrolase
MLPAILLRAAWIAPMNGPPVPNGGVVLRGETIVASGPAAALRAAHPGATVHDFGDAVVLPGLVNAHVHLELSHLVRPPAPGRFVDWLMSVLGSPADAATTAAAVESGVAQCLRFGVTTVGDISRHCVVARQVLRSSPLRAVSFGEVVGMAGRRHVLPDRLAAAVDDPLATQPNPEQNAGPGSAGPARFGAHAGARTNADPRQTLRAGVSPHAPYSIDADGYRRCLAAARERRLPLTTHLAESPDEGLFLAEHAGPFRELWDRLGAWDDSVPRFPGGPIRFAASLGLLDAPVALAHVNYCDDDEMRLLARGRAGVVYCPRTHAYFGHPPHRWRDMLAAGINVAVGTDSVASSPDLNLVDDLRLLHRIAPDVPPLVLWEMATTRAARALGLGAPAGALAPGAPADCAIFPASGSEPLKDVLESDRLPLQTWISGTPAPAARAVPPARSDPRRE